MRVIIASHTLKLTKALRNFAAKQASKLIRHHRQISQIKVFLEKRASPRRKAQVKFVVSLPGKGAVVVKRKATDMYAAIVDVNERVSRRLRKVRERRRNKRREKSGRDETPQL